MEKQLDIEVVEAQDTGLNIKINFAQVMKFALPSIFSMVVMGIFGAIDGVFVSRLIGVESLAAVNVSFPIIMAIMAIGSMIASGGSALVAKKKGEGLEEEARKNFSMLIVASTIGIGILSLVSFVFREPLLQFLGADAFLLPKSLTYITPILMLAPLISLAFIFQSFLIADGRPNLSMGVSIIGGLSNVALNYVFIQNLGWGLAGTAWATTIGYSIPAVVGLVYFAVARGGGLYFVKPTWDGSVMAKTFSNGLSEFVTMISVTVTSTFMNNIIMDIEGPLGVASVGIMLAVQGLITSLFMGYGFGIAPIISYNFGKSDVGNLKKIYALSLKIVAVLALFSIAIATVFASPLIQIYVDAGTPVYDMAVFGLRMVSMGFIFMAFNMFGSGMFTALNDGKTSAVISVSRSLVVLVITLSILPALFGMDGVWIALPVVEVVSVLVTVYFFRSKRRKYGYA